MVKKLSQIINEDIFDWSASSGSKEKKLGGTTITYGTDKNKTTELILLQTNPKMRGKGEAEKALKVFTSEADKNKHTIKLTAAPVYKGTDSTRLQAFYHKHGFRTTGIEHNGWKDFYNMERKPK